MARVFSEIATADARLAGVAAKVGRGERLFTEDALAILETRDLPALGQLADGAKRKRSGNLVYYSINKHVNYSNICELRCDFCRFSRGKDDPGAYQMSIEEVVAQIGPGVREVHLVGGLHPDLPLDHYLEMLARIRSERPGIGIKGFTAIEIDHFAGKAGLTPAETLARLKKAGLTSLPGGGAEIFSPRVRRILCPDKPSGKIWLDIHRTAHQQGIPSNATMLYGQVETHEERVSHLTALRELQDQTRGFLCFVPLPFQSWDGAPYRTPDPCEDLRMIALARLYLDNFPHIKAYWIMLGLETTAVSLCYGADDIDGTVQGERIAHAAGASTPQEIGGDLIRYLVAQTGKEAVERDSLYNLVKPC